MQVQQDVDRIDHGTDLARAIQFLRVPGTLQDRRVPHPVDVLVHEARQGGMLGIEPLEGSEVDEADREPAPQRHEALAQQPVQHDRAGIFVAVGQGEQPDMRPRCRGTQGDEAGNPGIALAPRVDIRRAHPHVEIRQGWLRDQLGHARRLTLAAG